MSTTLRIGLELLATEATSIRLGTYFETWVATASGAVRRSLGRDEYHLSLTVRAGRRLAATGRTCICQIDMEAAELGENQVRPAHLTALESLDAPAPVLWGIRTNLFLDQAKLCHGVTARLLREGTEPLSFPIKQHLLLAEQVSPGRYILDISSLLFPLEPKS